MTTLGTPYTHGAIRLLLLGSGELGKEVALSAQRLSVEVIAVDSYANAPAMQVAHHAHVIDMQDEAALLAIIQQQKPDLIVPEVEAIATNALITAEQQGYHVVPTAKATQLTMNRQGIRELAAETLQLNTSPYGFAHNKEAYLNIVNDIGLPCVVKPIMSSSGKGQSVLRDASQIDAAWQFAQTAGRGRDQGIIIEGFVDFDYEITLLTVRHRDGTSFCDPIGHRQVDGDYQESWQPHPMSDKALQQAQHHALAITEALGGTGLFGVEFFVKDDEVIFSEVSPRPHDTGMVTMISQNYSEFDLHVRAILGLPIANIKQLGPAASHVILVQGESQSVQFSNCHQALIQEDTDLRLFGKPEVHGKRRMGVSLALGATIDDARHKAKHVANTINIEL